MRDAVSILEKVHEILGTALQQFVNNSLTNVRKRKPSHMISKTQPRFFSTRKKRKTVEKAIDKPSPLKQFQFKTIWKQTCVVYVSQRKTGRLQKHISTGFHVFLANCGYTHHALTRLVQGTDWWIFNPVTAKFGNATSLVARDVVQLARFTGPAANVLDVSALLLPRKNVL